MTQLIYEAMTKHNLVMSAVEIPADESVEVRLPKPVLASKLGKEQVGLQLLGNDAVFPCTLSNLKRCSFLYGRMDDLEEGYKEPLAMVGQRDVSVVARQLAIVYIESVCTEQEQKRALDSMSPFLSVGQSVFYDNYISVDDRSQKEINALLSELLEIGAFMDMPSLRHFVYTTVILQLTEDVGGVPLRKRLRE